jgi:hypothetical protein
MLLRQLHFTLTMKRAEPILRIVLAGLIAVVFSVAALLTTFFIQNTMGPWQTIDVDPDNEHPLRLRADGVIDMTEEELDARDEALRKKAAPIIEAMRNTPPDMKRELSIAFQVYWWVFPVYFALSALVHRKCKVGLFPAVSFTLIISVFALGLITALPSLDSNDLGRLAIFGIVRPLFFPFVCVASLAFAYTSIVLGRKLVGRQ